MKLKNISMISLLMFNFVMADNRHLAPKYYTDEEIEAQFVREEQEEAARIAHFNQMKNNIYNFIQAEHCNPATIDLIKLYLQNQSIWDFLFDVVRPENMAVLADKINVIHLSIMSKKHEQLKFLCQELNKINKTKFLDRATEIEHKQPIQLCIEFQFWDGLITIIEYGADVKDVSLFENVLNNPATFSVFQDSVKKGQMLLRHRLGRKKKNTLKIEKKKRQEIKKLEEKALQEIENFSYGIDSDSDYY